MKQRLEIIMNDLRLISHQITFVEHPWYISLTLFISGCPLNCHNCHSVAEKDPMLGEVITDQLLIDLLDKNTGYIQNVVFLGGEWQAERLVELLQIVKQRKLLTTLYTGLNELDNNILKNLDYVKYGPYIEKLGPITNPQSNQKLIDLHNKVDISDIFHK